jgi:hypothetical protein
MRRSFALLAIGLLFGIAAVSIPLFYLVEKMSEKQADFFGPYFGSVFGLLALLFGALANAHIQREENQRLAAEEVRRRCISVFTDLEPAIIELHRVAGGLHMMAADAKIVPGNVAWLNLRALRTVKAVEASLRARSTDFGYVPWELAQILERVILCLVAVRGTIENMIETKDDLSPSNWYVVELPIRDGLICLLQCRLAMAKHLAIELRNGEEISTNIANLRNYTHAWHGSERVHVVNWDQHVRGRG